VFTVGVTEIVAMIGEAVEFNAVKAGMSPEPLAAKPIAVLSLVHVKVPPTGVLIKFVAAIAPLLHTTMFDGTATVGDGFTVIVYAEGVPAQLLALGVTVMVAVTTVDPEFTAVNVAISPVPLAAMPIDGLLLVHA
jgi:hypothetical protein